ncbi:aminotransferase class III-fold pyridoxal phosphate-dependent enzyme [Paralimibaculum aggregatum]|uniref:Aminotransferase class III-fold pyridoxal phosphate-dependent enzyme n=1 Tax=Paralimibaculum aggregatum TaxID=3036245 RepID=A0ABQ6LJ73_9RHOB|nr:aminotransferase class III-fold pyridoxal phosphate-dependent enzyme [Limibaculum sp. NKW23]GMG80828.1 aminotransferase class III-fold pyridoxal phosphate-dependent enzyme [Limibaculum sp. NKW23]
MTISDHSADAAAPAQADWIRRAQAVLPAGSFGNFPGDIVIESGEGARIRDADGRDYVDYLIGSGPMLVGHRHPEVIAAVQAQLASGLTFFANNPHGIALAEVIVDAVACAEQIRYVSTGSEADLYAMRLARAHTGRQKILKFEGGYHGMSDVALMSLAPKRLANFPEPVPDSAGIAEAVRGDVLVAPFNDLEAVRALVAAHGPEIAGIIVEPLQRLIPPEPGFLEGLREIASAQGIVLIFDEVVTGFRFGYGGAQALYGVTPDLCTLGKVIGGGFPLAAIAGPAAIMRHFDREAVGEDGFLYQVGTLSGNPVAAVAGLKTLEILRRPGTYAHIEAAGRRLQGAIRSAFAAAGVPVQVVGVPCLFDAVFTEAPVRNYRDIFHADRRRAMDFTRALRNRGVLKPDGKFYISAALTEADLALTEAAIAEAAPEVAAGAVTA